MKKEIRDPRYILLLSKIHCMTKIQRDMALFLGIKIYSVFHILLVGDCQRFWSWFKDENERRLSK